MREHAEQNHGGDAEYVVKNIGSFVAEKANDDAFSAEESFVDVVDQTEAVVENEDEDDDNEVTFQQLEVKVIHIDSHYFIIILNIFLTSPFVSRPTRASLPAATR